MLPHLDFTHEPDHRSWLDDGTEPSAEFPIQNLPWCVFRPQDSESPRIGVALGAYVVDLRCLAQEGCFSQLTRHPLDERLTNALQQPELNVVMALGRDERLRLRHALFEMFESSCPVLRDQRDLRRRAVFAANRVQYCLPAQVGDYTDFYASVFHATNVGSMFRPDQPLMPNYRWLPVAYHGRSSSLVISGTEIMRPRGQTSPTTEGEAPAFQATRMLDYELELGIWIAEGNPMGHPLTMPEAEQRWFGVCLLNDWSARDIQRWEYQPLGPFLAKNFATSISPWIVTAEALAPFRTPAFPRGPEEPRPLPHLDHAWNRDWGGLDLELCVQLSSQAMREQGMAPIQVSLANFREMYWTVAQMIAHHTSNGCNLRPGDLLGSGTISGPHRESRGCLLERTWDGEYGAPLPGTARTPLRLPTGEERLFLSDGDEVIFTGRCTREGYRPIGLGICRGMIRSAH